MLKLYHMRSAKLDKRYLVAGKAWGHWRTVNTQRGLRGFAENMVLPLTYLAAKIEPVTEPILLTEWQVLNEALSGIGWAMLLNTGYYNYSHFVGVIGLEKRNIFIKNFKCPRKATEVSNNSQKFMAQFSKIACFLSFLGQSGRILKYDCLPKVGRLKKMDQAEKLCFNMCSVSFQQSRNGTTPDFSDVWSYCQLQYNLPKEMPFCLAHGDFTPWNCLETSSGEIYIVDLDDVGFHAPFYDYFHWHTQPLSVIGKSNLNWHTLFTSINHESSKDWLIYYLAHQLSGHLRDLEKKQNQLRLTKAIKSKAKMLCNLAK